MKMKRNTLQNWTTLFFESTKIENAAYQAALSEAKFKTNIMESTNWAQHKERSFARNYIIFMKTMFQFQKLIWCVNHPTIYIHTFHKRWRLIWGCLFPMIILNSISIFRIHMRTSANFRVTAYFKWSKVNLLLSRSWYFCLQNTLLFDV